MALTFTEQPSNLSFSKNPIVFKVNTDDLFVAPGVRRPNFFISLQIVMQKVTAGPFILVATLEAVPDDNGDVNFDLSSILDAELQDSFDIPNLPVFGDDSPYISDVSRNYAVQADEWFGQPPVANVPITSTVKGVICGGVSNDTFADNDYLNDIDVNTSILSWYPDGKQIAPDQPEYLSYFHYPLSTEVLTLETLTTLKNGTTVSFSIPLISIDPLQVMTIPVGWDQLGLATPIEDVRKYSVRVKQGLANFRSPFRTYYIDCNYYECWTDLLYLNAFWMPEMLRTKGQWTKALEVERFTSERILAPGYEAVNGQRFQYKAMPDNVYTVRTGFVSKAESEALQELFINNGLFQIHYKSGRYIPLEIEDKKTDVTQCLQYLHFYQFTVRRSMRMRNYDNSGL